MIFVYEVPYMQGFLKQHSFKVGCAYQKEIKTAEGYLVPCEIPELTAIDVPYMKSDKFKNKCDSGADTSEKGEWAVKIVKDQLKKGKIPLRFDVDEVKEKNMQIQGKDIIAIGAFSMQVKCDWRAGPREKGGTGNLFIQISECNPHGKH